MSLRTRILSGPPERRQTDVTPIVERRTEEEQLPRWRRWTMENQGGKDLTGRAAA